jgi:transposase
MARVFIGVDRHKLSATIEVVDEHETVLAAGRFGTDRSGYAAMRKTVSGWPERVWAVEGSNGAGRPLVQRLLADGEQVVDVPAKLSARARLFDTGHNRKTDAHDAHAVAVVAVRTKGLRVLSYDAEFEALRMLADRREELTRGRAKKDITTGRARTILSSVRPRDLAGKPAAGSQPSSSPSWSRSRRDHHQTAQGDGAGPWVEVDGPARYRTGRRGPDPGRRR